MSDSLPERPDLAQLRRQAKELRDAARREEAGAVERFVRHHGRAPQGSVTLAAAQLVIARELGFASWPRLAAAAVLGDAQQVAQMLAVDPAAAVAIDEVRGWPPLLYACYSRWQQIDPRRAAGLTEVVRLLLDAGASPNTNDGARYPRSALKGSVEANNPDMTGVLLEAGANPDVGQPIAEAVGRGDHRCLELLLSHGARVAGTWAVGAAVYHDDPRAVALLLQAVGAGAGQAERQATEALPDAAASASADVAAVLLAAGADPNANDEHGVSALRLAVRAGENETAALLASGGAPDDSTDIDRFIGACRRADRPAAEQLLAGSDVDARDARFDGTPLAFATVGSGEQA